MSSRLLFKASAVTEILIGIALLAAPSLIIELLLGDGLGSVGVAAVRILGVGLLSVFGAIGGFKGMLLWPTAIIHGLIGAVMLRVLLTSPSISD